MELDAKVTNPTKCSGGLRSRRQLLKLGVRRKTAEMILVICTEGLTHKEAAIRFGCTKQNVTQRIARVRRRIFLWQLNRLPGRPKGNFKANSPYIERL